MTNRKHNCDNKGSFEVAVQDWIDSKEMKSLEVPENLKQFWKTELKDLLCTEKTLDQAADSLKGK